MNKLRKQIDDNKDFKIMNSLLFSIINLCANNKNNNNNYNNKYLFGQKTEIIELIFIIISDNIDNVDDYYNNYNNFSKNLELLFWALFNILYNNNNNIVIITSDVDKWISIIDIINNSDYYNNNIKYKAKEIITKIIPNDLIIMYRMEMERKRLEGCCCYCN